jgi:hypothetical protein
VLQLLSEVVSDLFVGHPKLFLVLVRPTRTPTARWLAGWLAGCSQWIDRRFDSPARRLVHLT